MTTLRKLDRLSRSSSRDQTYDWWNENGQTTASPSYPHMEGGANSQTAASRWRKDAADRAGQEVEAKATLTMSYFLLPASVEGWSLQALPRIVPLFAGWSRT